MYFRNYRLLKSLLENCVKSTFSEQALQSTCESIAMQLPIQMQLSEKQKKISEFFVPFLDSTSNFEHFERKHERHS